MRHFLLLLLILTLASRGFSQTNVVRKLDIGSPSFVELYVHPTLGNDANTGRSSLQPFRSLAQAWRAVPNDVAGGGVGYRINLFPGEYPSELIPHYMENKIGSYSAPVIITSQDSNNRAILRAGLNIFNVRNLYLIDFNIAPLPSADVVHLEQGENFLLRGMILNGSADGVRGAHETLKINQSRHVYVEGSDIGGSYENAIDFVAVQYGHIVGNRIHSADDWCMYVKGGSAYFSIANNFIDSCGTGGFVAGQGTGFEFMTSPWIHYEAYDVKFFNNIVRDTEGAAFGVNGGYNILIAHNTAYRVGSRSHLVEVVYGYRSCDGDSVQCTARNSLGGWGPTIAGAPEAPIPNKNVKIINNIILNPTGFQSRWQHFAVYSPRSTPAGSNLPATVSADTNLEIKGNIIYNGDSSMPLGVGDGEGCLDSNVSCNAAQLVRDNQINQFYPALQNPGAQDFRPVVSSNIFSNLYSQSASFNGLDRELMPLAPLGVLGNNLQEDRGGIALGESVYPGAYQQANSPLNLDFFNLPGSAPVTPEEPVTPSPVDPNQSVITIKKLKYKFSRRDLRVSVNLKVTDPQGVKKVSMAIYNQITGGIKRFTLKKKGGGVWYADKKYSKWVRQGVRHGASVILATDKQNNQTALNLSF